MHVLEPGVVQAGDDWALQERFNPNGAIPLINQCLYLRFDPDYAKQMAEMTGLADWWKELVLEKQEKYGNHWTETMKD